MVVIIHNSIRFSFFGRNYIQYFTCSVGWTVLVWVTSAVEICMGKTAMVGWADRIAFLLSRRSINIGFRTGCSNRLRADLNFLVSGSAVTVGVKSVGANIERQYLTACIRWTHFVRVSSTALLRNQIEAAVMVFAQSFAVISPIQCLYQGLSADILNRKWANLGFRLGSSRLTTRVPEDSIAAIRVTISLFIVVVVHHEIIIIILEFIAKAPI